MLEYLYEMSRLVYYTYLGSPWQQTSSRDGNTKCKGVIEQYNLQMLPFDACTKSDGMVQEGRLCK